MARRECFTLWRCRRRHGYSRLLPLIPLLRLLWCAAEWWDETHERFYYVSVASGEVSWDLPAYLNKLLRRFGEWAEYWDVASQHVFFFNTLTNARSWEPPTELEFGGGDIVEVPGMEGERGEG